MSFIIEVEKKIKTDIKRKVKKPEDVFLLEEVQEIKEAIQEHLLFIGLDNANNVRTINIMAIGKRNEMYIDSRDIIRTAITTASDKVILVHNHPSIELKPSNHDIQLTNSMKKLLEVFNIIFLDHIIVSEKGFLSMGETKAIDEAYENDKFNFLEKVLLFEENNKLKTEIEELNKKLYNKQKQIEDDEENVEL